MSLLKLSAIAGVAVSIAACGIQKKTDEMQSAMDRMQNSMNDMQRETREIKAQSEHLGDATDGLHKDLTYDRSAWSMTEALNHLWAENSDTKPKDPEMLIYAGMAMLSMWQEFWTGFADETVDTLDGQMVLSTQVLMARVMSHAPAGHKVDVMNPDLDYQGVAALAAKLDQTSDDFPLALAKKNIKSFTFYDLVVEALRNRNEPERKEQFPRTAAMILQFQQDAIYVLQIRHNYLPFMVYAFMTGFKDKSDLERAGLVLLGGNINVDVNSFGPEQLKEWTRWLKASAQTRADLKSMGVELEYNNTMRGLSRKLNFNQQALAALPANKLNGLRKLQHDFAQAYMDAMN